ncbi:MAG: pyridoxamine 5'-phosphate oxidase family protein [Anaerolineales bacterium]
MTPAKPSRPDMPGYGIVGEKEGAGLLPWSFAEERMAKARNYWIGTVSPDGRPHAAPVWGLWHASAFYFSTGSHSRKGRNLAAQPAVSVHSESGDEAVMFEGHVEKVSDKALLKALDKAYKGKYGLPMQVPGIIFQLNAERVFAWREKDFPESATRWIFG